MLVQNVERPEGLSVVRSVMDQAIESAIGLSDNGEGRTTKHGCGTEVEVGSQVTCKIHDICNCPKMVAVINSSAFIVRRWRNLRWRHATDVMEQGGMIALVAAAPATTIRMAKL